MAKNWQYGRLRAIALQVVMWLIFGASLGLAAYIDHRKSGQLDVRLGEPRTLGRLTVRLPHGWEVEEDAGPPQALVAKDFDRQGRHRRTLRITQEQQTGRTRGAEYYLENTINLPDVEQIPNTEPFAFPGENDGALVTFIIDNPRALRRLHPEIPDAGMYACAVMPDGLTLTVQLTGEGTYGPSSRQLIRLVADNIKVTDTATATKPAR
jgi:hypothetical protein